MKKITYALIFCLMSSLLNTIFASDSESDCQNPKSFVPPIPTDYFEIDEGLRPAEYYKVLKPYLSREDEHNELLANFSEYNTGRLKTILKNFWQFRFCEGVDGLSLLLTANKIGLELDRGFESQFLALRVWMKSPELKPLKIFRRVMPVAAWGFCILPLTGGNPVHVPTDAKIVINFAHSWTFGRDLLNWANMNAIITRVPTYEPAHTIGWVTTSIFFLIPPLLRDPVFMDYGSSTVHGIRKRIQARDEYDAKNGIEKHLIHGAVLTTLASWNWATLLKTMTGTLIENKRLLFPDELAMNMTSQLNCYIELWYNQYIPCNTTLPLKYQAQHYVTEATTYIAEASPSSVMHWMIPHFINLLWFYMMIIRL